MNNEQQTWILKPGHEILNGKDNDYEWTALVKPGEDVTTGFCSTISTTIWEKHFMPLSVSGLTRQVEDEIDYVMEKAIMNHITSEAIDADGSEMHESIKDQAVKAIVLLLLNQEGETKK